MLSEDESSVMAKASAAETVIAEMENEIARLRAELDRRGPLVCSGCGVHEHDHETYCGEPSYERQSSDDGSTSPDRCGEWISRGEYDLRADLDRRPEITPEDARIFVDWWDSDLPSTDSAVRTVNTLRAHAAKAVRP